MPNHASRPGLIYWLFNILGLIVTVEVLPELMISLDLLSLPYVSKRLNAYAVAAILANILIPMICLYTMLSSYLRSRRTPPKGVLKNPRFHAGWATFLVWACGAVR